MTGIAVVASAQDAKFAEEVRAGLQASGHDASVSQSLPRAAGPHVVLIWSAPLEANRAIDAQALIGLWSEDRLLVARRDATPLPLGLRDLPSLGPEANGLEVAAAAHAMTADRPVAPELKQLSRRYELVRVIGKGSMGIVYEGMDPRLHRQVAIKTIRKDQSEDAEIAKDYSMRFKREAQAVARLNHPHIVQVYDFGEEAEVAYIVMEFVRGKDLKSFFEANVRFELKEAVRIMCELLDALDFAHEAGIVHRDVKPANVMLDGQARVKLADFGVARLADDRLAKDKAQAGGVMFGGMVCMSPEQITGGNVDRRSDIFSAGIILYQLLTGEKPFTGPGAWTIAKKIIQDHPPVPSSLNNTISPLFDNVVNKALSKTTDGRYQTAKEFGAALRRALEGKSDEDESDKTVVGSMGDLPSLTRRADSYASARSEGTKGTGSPDLEFEFWRAIKDGNDPDDFELYVQQFPTGNYTALAKRKIAKLRGTGPDKPHAAELEKYEVEKAPGARKSMGPIVALLVAIVLMGGGAWYYFSKSGIEKQAALTALLEDAAKASQELRQAQAKQLESLKALEQARAVEDAARKSGDMAKLKETQEATKRAEAEANKQAELVKQREAAAADARKEAQDSARLARSAETAKAEAPQKTEVAAAAPKAVASAPSTKGPDDTYETLYEQARVLEQDGRAAEAVRVYRRAARAGSGKAAKRLGEVYDKGIPGIARDHAESLQWYETARRLGESIGPIPAPAPLPPSPAQPEPPKAAAPAPAPAPAKPAAEPPAPAPEAKSGWLSVRGWLIALLVLGFIYWRRSRRRAKAKAMARQPLPQSRQQSDDASTLGAARSVYRPSKVVPPDDAALFVSYSHKDRSRVEPIVSVIEEMGRRVWMDRSDITGQTGWAGQIVRAIRECRAVVLMASPNSYTSDQVVRELYLAMNHRKTIVPIEIEPAELPDELQYILAPFQHHRLSAGETRAVLGRALAAV